MPPVPPITLDTQLPIAQRASEIIAAIQRHRAVVVCGQTGSGKTTQLPLIALLAGRGQRGMIAHTQPRRIAARAVAARLAQELGEDLGQTVGFKVRFSDQTSKRTKIKLLTDGLLLAETQGDRLLERYDTIIIDEAHERSLNIDFLLGYLRRLLDQRPELKVIVTSATIDTRRFSEHFGGESHCPVIEVSGRMYPVEVRYRPMGDDTDDDLEEIEEHAVVNAVDELISPKNPEGDVLVFLPGEREIRVCERALRQHLVGSAEILPLYARLSSEEQDRIFKPGPQRRVILATNVAETSLTVPRIRYVVDAGLARLSRYDHRTKVQRLPVEPISRASAEQRSGRCGRVSAGVCVRLYSERSFTERPAYTDPEVLRTNLASVILTMKAYALGAVEDFPFVQRPDAGMIADGYETLFELGAIDRPDAGGQVTPIGQSLSRLPVDPRIGRMLLAGAAEGCLREVRVLAAVLSAQDPRERPFGRESAAERAQAVFRDEESDFITLLNVWDAYRDAADRLTHRPLHDWCRERFLSFNRLREWGDVVAQLRELGEELDLAENPAPASSDSVHRALLTGLLGSVCVRDEASTSYEYLAPRGVTCQIFPGSVLFKKNPRWFVAGEIVETTRRYARTLAKIDPGWIAELGAHVLHRHTENPHYDAGTGEPSVFERVTLWGLSVSPRRRARLSEFDKPASRALFIEKALVEGHYTPIDSVPAFWTHNQQLLERAKLAEGRLRRRDVLAPPAQRGAFYDARLPKEVVDQVTFELWRLRAEEQDPRRLCMSESDVLTPASASAFDPGLFPESLTLAGLACPLVYRFEPGKDTDGVTLSVPLLALGAFTPDRAGWLVPGLLGDKVHALLKTLPKALRERLEHAGDLGTLARELAGVMDFASGPLETVLSETIALLREVTIPPGSFAPKGIGEHLHLRVRVLEESGTQISCSRDVSELHRKLAPRLARAQADAARVLFVREGLLTWDFDELPERVSVSHAGSAHDAFPAIDDRGDSVALTLCETSDEARLASELGVRRLLVLGVREELEHRLDALPDWSELLSLHKSLGTPDELRDALMGLIVQRVFTCGQEPIRTRAQFEQRLAEGWGRLGQACLEVGGLVYKILEPRSKVAHRLSGGTPRLWAASIADIREQAAYLLPAGFLKLVPYERLREYPRYASAMRQRLLDLREDGSGSETAALAALAPHWKRFTLWVARTMSEAKAREAAAGVESKAGASKPALPGSRGRRATPTINADAGLWALQPGHLPAEVSAYRWAVEDARVTLFGGGKIEGKRLEELWVKVPSTSER